METMDPGYGGYGGGGSSKSSLLERLKGVALFRPPMYREIAKDEEATGSAVMVLVIFSVIAGIISGALFPVQMQLQMQQSPELQQALFELGIDPATFLGVGALVAAAAGAVLNPLISLLGWLIFSSLNAFVANRFFGGNTDTSQIMRVFGYAYVFAPIGALPCIGLVVLVLSLVANTIGVREAADLDTGNAILTVIVSLVIIIAVLFLLGCCFVLLIASLAAAGSS
jgi:hypothetical protein